MLYLIPRPLHRLALRTAHGLRIRWWRIRRPSLLGCRVLAFDPAGAVLLIRHSYGSGRWMLPGGGMARGEDPLSAARRELREETGCSLHFARQFGLVEEPLYGAINRVHLIAGSIVAEPRADGREVIEVRLFPPDRLPADLAGIFARELPGWIIAAEAAPPPAD